ncbi:carboxymuconolactone decarboxylase family protein [Flavivirga abyssicola]|uniref:carboxymuconolactone decarboxylase family protein n=1 Tax=Flavivirga abyssicola TaxID=3063533 RepID=UPI0026E0C85B|nr:carboxymuconolactone decarboxylase family protein [Flavivirga sp. MEBiC07777]WVK13553.1 carboxymuconolactone decarboxylase family protein [Flavivirga sp. MEBiC07777]
MERISYADIPEGMFENLRVIEDFLNNSPLDNKLMELVKLRVSQKNGCAYCVDMHYKELKHTGETELRLSSLCVWEETPYFSTKERIVLKFAETLTKINRAPIPEDVYTPLLDYFNKNEVCYLTLAITQINTWNRLMKVFLFTPGNYKVGDQ